MPHTDGAKQRFQTYLFFLRHLDILIRMGRNSSLSSALISSIISEQKPLLRAEKKRHLGQSEQSSIKKLLFNAWNSETVARMNSRFDSDVRFITNQWKPIQTYYAIYFLLAAIHLVFDSKRRDQHSVTLQFATNSISGKLVRPWCCRYNFETRECFGFPWHTPPRLSAGWNLANQEPYAFLANFYRTTGSLKRHDKWSEQKGRRHPPPHPRAGRRIQQSDVPGGYISIWNALGRMRKWVNYKEAAALLEGQRLMSQPHIDEFDEALNSILTGSAAVLECYLSVLVESEMRAFYQEYRQMMGQFACSEFLERYDVIFSQQS
ncbi:MAG TPA: hypothetical protein VMU16_01015 [Candidatus Binataceae bacterium]|nr:hypothetical protein [Candidatus Binataceae bacterium]